MKKVISKIKKLITHHASRITDAKGFTLIELAIVLVIIGIIIGAVIKGQDLIDGARQKRLIAEIKQWETMTWTYFERYGRFPGDRPPYDDGIIGDSNARAHLESSGLTNVPTTNKLVLGSLPLYIFLGHVDRRYNKIAVCVSEMCDRAFSEQAVLDFARAVDTSFDGMANGTSGRVRAVTGNLFVASHAWLVTTTTPNYVDWTPDTKALIYFFDRQPRP